MALRCSAFATAESSTFSTTGFGPSWLKRRTRRASSTCRPRIMSMERRTLRGAIRTYFAEALPSTPSPLLLQCRASFGVVAVRPERPRQRELPELVPHHGLGDVHRNVLAP